MIGSLILVLVAIWLAAFPSAAKTGNQGQAGRKETPGDETFKPVPLPDPGIPGFKFPENEQTILDWVKNNDQHSINCHAWGLWTALTAKSGQFANGQELLVFETWPVPHDLLVTQFQPNRKLATLPRNPRALSRLRQLQLGRAKAGQETVLGSVRYDPNAAKHIVDNKLFSQSRLTGLLNMGQKEIPSFPSTAVSLKAVFRILDQSTLVQGQYFMLPAWPGPPDPLKAFPPSAWNQCVWIDVKETGVGSGTGKVDSICKPDGSSRTADNTYGLGRFINFRLSPEQARLANEVRTAASGKREFFATEGNYAVLVGMHVTTREITRWIWSTFWWSPNPDRPPLPSSTIIAQDRPDQLKGAPRNYSHVSSYSMVFPDQPNTGGTNTGDSVYAYNPWLEAGFGPTALPASKPGTYQGKPVANNVGVQTNCMSCHAHAAYSPNQDLSTTLYTGDHYIDLKGPQFNGKLRIDFLWSVADNATTIP